MREKSRVLKLALGTLKTGFLRAAERNYIRQEIQDIRKTQENQQQGILPEHYKKPYWLPGSMLVLQILVF